MTVVPAVFGPSPRSYTFKINRKERAAALRSALSVHAARGSVAVFDPAPFVDAPSTKAGLKLLSSWDRKGATLLVLTDEQEFVSPFVPEPSRRPACCPSARSALPI